VEEVSNAARRELLLATIGKMDKPMQDCIRDLVLNRGEVRVSAWEDCNLHNVGELTVKRSRTIHHVVNGT
jgi:hypothetical protein